MKSSDKIIAFIVAFYILIALRPSFTWSLPSNFMMYLQTIPIVLFATRLELKKIGDLLFLFVFISLFLFLCLIKHYNLTYSALVLSLAIVPFVKKRLTVQAMDYFRKLLAAVLGISLIVFLLVSIGVPMGGHIIPPLNTAKDYNYVSYPLLVMPTSFTPRFHGPFDEPGVVGTIGLILLVTNKFRLRDFWNLVIFIACIFSFSFAFFGGSIVYLLVRLVSNRNKSLLYLLIGVAVFYLVTSHIPVFQENIYSRMVYNEDSGKFAGDSRTTVQMDEFFDSIRFTSVYWWGTDREDLIMNMFGGSSYKKAIVQYGVVFILLYYLWIWLFAAHNGLKRSQLLVFIALMLVNLYQRPALLNFTYLFLYVSYIKLCACENEDNLRGVIS